MDSSSVQIDGFGPVPLQQPDTVAEVSEVVRQVRGQQQAIYPFGGGTCQGLGLTPVRPGVALGTSRLDRVIDYPAKDMTITVQAGIRVHELQNLLAREKQRLSVDVARCDQATLGGALAVNASGPRRFACGTLRDYLIGVSFVNDQGHEIKSGGRVVKNVAGYDMCKLLVGSLGTLGIITQATLKVRPIPEAQAFLVVPTPFEKIDELLKLIHESQTRPSCVELLNGAAGGALPCENRGKGWVVLIGMEENEPAVAWQKVRLKDELIAAGFEPCQEIEGSACEAIWQALIDFAAKPGPVFRIRLSLPPQHLGGLLNLVPSNEPSWGIQAHAGNGIVLVQGNAAIGKLPAANLFRGLLEFASSVGGHAIVEDCPPEWKADLPIWGKPRNDYWLMRRVKDQLDPDNIFNPGRFVDGI